MKLAALFLLSAISTYAAESLEIEITRTTRYWFFTHSTSERHVVGISSDQPAAGVFAFDERARFVTTGYEVIPLTPGATATRTDLDVKRTGGQFIFSRSADGLTFDLFYRRDVLPKEPSDAGLKDTHLSGRVSTDPKKPTVLKHVTPSISKIVLTHRSH